MRNDILTADLAAERANAVKFLLRAPLLDVIAEPEAFKLVVRHHEWLTEWFDTTCGWQLTVDIGSGFARLGKRPVGGTIDTSRPLRRLRGARQPFDRRRYQLLCLVAAELVQHPVTTIGLLAQAITAESGLDTGRHGERTALVDALRVLIEWGGVHASAGDIDDFVNSEHGNAVLHAETTRLHWLIVTTIAPSSLPDAISFDDVITQLLAEPRYGSASAPEEHDITDTDQRLRWVRHSIGRRALDNPVTHIDELDSAERDYLDNPSGRAWLRVRVADAGFDLEERADGFLAVDSTGVATDIEFPGPHGNAHQLALLLVDQLLVAGPDGATRQPTTLSAAHLERAVEAVFERFTNWAKTSRHPEGRRALADQAVAVLEAFGLARRTANGGLEGRPAIARYRVGEPTTTNDPMLFV